MRCRCEQLGYMCPSCETYYTNSDKYKHIHDARFDANGRFIGRDSDKWRNDFEGDFRGDWDD